jgi:hypothetical protein
MQSLKGLKATKASEWLHWRLFIVLAGEQGFEPWNAGIKIRCLNQLGDSPTQSDVCRSHITSD